MAYIARVLAPLFVVAWTSVAGAQVHVRNPAQIPMRDSPSTLAADAYLPPGTGPWPAVLIQTPYNKNSFVLAFTTAFTGDPLFQSLDYAFVVLDWRGFFASAGAAHSGSPNHGQDGYDAVEWIAAQSWCTGNVGTGGPSASPTTPAHIPPPEPRALN